MFPPQSYTTRCRLHNHGAAEVASAKYYERSLRLTDRFRLLLKTYLRIKFVAPAELPVPHAPIREGPLPASSSFISTQLPDVSV